MCFIGTSKGTSKSSLNQPLTFKSKVKSSGYSVAPRYIYNCRYTSLALASVIIPAHCMYTYEVPIMEFTGLMTDELQCIYLHVGQKCSLPRHGPRRQLAALVAVKLANKSKEHIAFYMCIGMSMHVVQ